MGDSCAPLRIFGRKKLYENSIFFVTRYAASCAYIATTIYAGSEVVDVCQ